MNNNNLPQPFGKYTPPPPPTISIEQLPKTNTQGFGSLPPADPIGMLPPPSPSQDRGFWFNPMVSKEAVAGAPDWIRPVAEFATELTTPFDVALTLGTAGFGGVAATALRGGTKAIQAGTKANIFRRGLAGLVDPMGGARAALPARVIAETGLTAGGHYGAKKGEEIGGLPGAVVGALGVGLAGGMAGIGLAKGMGKGLQKAPGTRILFEDPWGREKHINPESPTETHSYDPSKLNDAESPEDLEFLFGNKNENSPYGYETQFMDPVKGGTPAKNETLDSVIGRRLNQIQSPLKRTMHKIGRIIAPNYYVRTFLEDSLNRLYRAEGEAAKDAKVLMDWVGMERWERVFGVTEEEIGKRGYSFLKLYDDNGNIIKDHPLFTEANIKKIEEARGVIGKDKDGKNIIGKLVPNIEELNILRILEETKPLEDNWHLREAKPETRIVYDGITKEGKKIKTGRIIYGDSVGVNWGEILNDEQKRMLKRLAQVNKWTGERGLENGIDFFNRAAKGKNARQDSEMSDLLGFTKKELNEMADEAVNDGTMTAADRALFGEGLTSPTGYANRKFMYRELDPDNVNPYGEVIIVGNNGTAWKVDARIGAENKRVFTKVNLAQQEGYRYMPLDKAFILSTQQRLRRVATAAHEKWKKKMISGGTYIDPDTGEVVEFAGVFGKNVKVESATERALRILYRGDVKDLGITPEQAEINIRKWEAGEKVADPHIITKEIEIANLQSYLNDILFDPETNTLREEITLTETDIRQLKNIVNYLDDTKDEVLQEAAEQIRAIWANADGDDIIPTLESIRADGLGNKTFTTILRNLPMFDRWNETLGKEQINFAIVLAHARRLMGTDYVNNLPTTQGVGDQGFDYKGATNALKSVINDYKLNVNKQIDTEIVNLEMQIKDLNDNYQNVLRQQEISGVYLEDPLDEITAQITFLQGKQDNLYGLKALYKQRGKPKSLNFDGQDYIRGLSYGVNGWNPIGRGYTDGSSLDSVFQLLKETNIPDSVLDDLKFAEDIMEKAYHTKVNPFDNKTITRGLQAIRDQLIHERKVIRTRIDEAMKQALIKQNNQELMFKTQRDFITKSQINEGFARAAFTLRELPDVNSPKFFRWLRDQPDVDPKAPYRKDIASERTIAQRLGLEEGYMDGFPVGSDEQTWFVTLDRSAAALDSAADRNPMSAFREAIEFKNEMDNAMERGDLGKMQKAWLRANATQRMIALGFDASVFNIHLLPTWFNHPQAPVRAWKGFWKAALGGLSESSEMVQKYKITGEARAVRDFFGPELLMSDSQEVFEQNAKNGTYKVFSKITKRLENAFGHSLDIAGIEMGKALMYLVDMNASPQVIARQKKQIAQYINNMRGLSDSSLAGISPNQQNIEAMGFLAARYRRATAAIWVKAFNGEPLEKYMAQKALINLFTGVFMATVGLQIGSSALRGDSPEETLEKLERMTDPSSSDFLLFSLNNQKVGPGSKFVSDARILSKAMNFFYKTGTQEDMEDWENFMALHDDNPGLRWVRSQLAWTPSTAWDFLVGENYIGEPQFREGDSGFDTLTNFVEPFGDMVIPMWLSGSVLENTQGGLEWGDRFTGMGTRGASEFVGLRAHPQSAAGILRESSWDILNTPYKNLEPFQKDILRYSLMDQLTPLQEQQVKRGTNDFALYFNDIERIEKEFQNELLYMTKVYPNTPEGNRNMYDRYRQLKSYTRGRKHELGYDIDFDEPDPNVTDPKKIALNKYYALFEKTRIPGTQMQDWDMWEIEYEQLMNSLSIEQQAVIARNTSRTSIPYQFLERIRYLGEAKEYKRIMKAQQLRELYLGAQERDDLIQTSRKLYLME